MELRQNLLKSLSIYQELNELTDRIYDAVNTQKGDFTTLQSQLDNLRQQAIACDSTLPANLETISDPELVECINKRYSAMSELLEKSRLYSTSLNSKKRVIADEIRKIKQGRGSLPAYRSESDNSGKIIQNRY